jgi:hypothetical protein
MTDVSEVVPAVPQFLSFGVPAAVGAAQTQFFVTVDTPQNRYLAAQLAIQNWGEANNDHLIPPPALIWVAGHVGSIPASIVEPDVKAAKNGKVVK